MVEWVTELSSIEEAGIDEHRQKRGEHMDISTEFQKRWKSIQEQMAGEDVDLLCIYSNDKAVHGPGNVRYVSDVPTHFEDTAVIISQKGDPVLAVGPESPEFAAFHSYIPDIRVAEEFAIPEEEYPHTAMTSMKEIRKELEQREGREFSVIGMVGLDIIPQRTYQRMEGSILSQCTVVDANEMFYRLRGIKSPYEIGLIEQGYAIADKAMEACINAVKPGVSEREIALEGEYVMKQMGAEGFAIDTIVSSGRERTAAIFSRPTDRTIKNGDLVVITVGPRFCGYNPAIGRPVIVGEVSAQIERAMEAALEAQFAVEEKLRPGAAGRDVEGIARSMLAEKNLEQYFVYAGVHSVGFAEFEPPILSPKSSLTVQEGMVFSIDIPIFLAPWGGLRYEDGFTVTKDGSRRLNAFPREIIRV